MSAVLRTNDISYAVIEKRGSISLSVDTRMHTDVYNFDFEGRFWSGIIKKTSYRRGLNGGILARWFDPQGYPVSRYLLDQEKKEFFHHLISLLNNSIVELFINDNYPKTGFSRKAKCVVKKARKFNYRESIHDETEFLRIYGSGGILPPDQYQSLVLNATEGCSYNKCDFCEFYKDQKFSTKTIFEFRNHITELIDYLGEGILLRRNIFLGAANAVCAPMESLEPILLEINSKHDLLNYESISSFMDGFNGINKSISDYHKLAQLGLSRIYIGMETGSDALIKLLHKPGNSSDVLNTVDRIKSAGISVGIIIMIGIGGQEYNSSHVEDTVKLVNKMNLGSSDIIFFSELSYVDNSPFHQNMIKRGISPLSISENVEQEKCISDGFEFTEDAGTPHISKYDINEFIY